MNLLIISPLTPRKYGYLWLGWKTGLSFTLSMVKCKNSLALSHWYVFYQMYDAVKKQKKNKEILLRYILLHQFKGLNQSDGTLGLYMQEHATTDIWVMLISVEPRMQINALDTLLKTIGLPGPLPELMASVVSADCWLKIFSVTQIVMACGGCPIVW